jgi:transcriptional regulator with XRE-family HTH domain
MTTMVATMTAELAGYLRTEIRQRGWSERRLAREAGISLSALQNILNDEHTVPTLATLRSLAQALGVQMARLIELLGYSLGDAPSRTPTLYALTGADLDELASLSSDELREILALVRKLRGR